MTDEHETEESYWIGQESADIIARCIEELVSDKPKDDRFAILDAIAYQVERSLFPQPRAKHFLEDASDPEFQRRLLTHPAAPYCARRPNFDHPCRLNIDQGWKPVSCEAGCG
jgi:hypothetical protein